MFCPVHALAAALKQLMHKFWVAIHIWQVHVPPQIWPCMRHVSSINASSWVDSCKLLCTLQVVDIEIPELELVRVAQMVSIGCEIAQACKGAYSNPKTRQQMNFDTRITLASTSRFLATDFLQVRTPKWLIELLKNCKAAKLHDNMILVWQRTSLVTQHRCWDQQHIIWLPEENPKQSYQVGSLSKMQA